MVVHGGAGNSPVRDEAPLHAGLKRAVEAAAAALEQGALAAAVAAVEVLEDDPHFNAGRGSVRTSAGHVEMDAAVMDGRTGRAGAVALVTTVRHPVALARAVMDATQQVMLAGEGAERFAAEQGLERKPPDWFIAATRTQAPGPGTVGAVVRDEEGALAAATSTGGRRGQPPGRIGDSPLIGAGTFADGRRAISLTGDGEAIIRAVTAHTVALDPQPLEQAAEQAIAWLTRANAEAGLIAIDADGTLAMPANTRVMNRAWWTGAEIETRVRT